jgi:hypothetical protein
MMEMDRVKTGIDGLDEMLEGPTEIAGGRGHGVLRYGKDHLRPAVHQQGLKQGEKGIFISLEEDQESILAAARAFQWDLAPYIEQRKLAIVKLEPTDAKTTITRIRSELPTSSRASGRRASSSIPSRCSTSSRGGPREAVQPVQPDPDDQEDRRHRLMTAEVNDNNPTPPGTAWWSTRWTGSSP